MTTIKTASLLSLLIIAGAGTLTAHASEVTGTLSSSAASSTAAVGNIGGTVGEQSGVTTDDEDRDSGGGGRSNRSRSDSTPPGSVLGATTDNVASPGFPNAGMEPSTPSLSSRLLHFLRSLITF